MKVKRILVPCALALVILSILLMGVAGAAPGVADTTSLPRTAALAAPMTVRHTQPLNADAGSVTIKKDASAAAYSLTDSIVIDGVFTGALIDGDGTATAGVGSAHPTKFVEQKKFDAADLVYYADVDGIAGASAGDHYWIDNGDGAYWGSDDAVIVGAPVGGTIGDPVDALAGETAIAYNDAEINDNNRYDDGEDIYLVDSESEFRGAAMQRIVYDPLYPGSRQILAHIYIANTTDTVFMHNDFIVDTESVWIDDGITNTVAGTQEAIGFQPFTNTISSTLNVQIFGRWFTAADDVYWKSTGSFTGTWAAGDSLWLDVDGNGVYDTGADLVLISTGDLSDGDIGRELNSDGLDPTYNFTYNDENDNGHWDIGEDISTLDGDEIYDWNYFDDRWSWLVDGDGTVTDGRGSEDLTRIDGNTWFQAGDQVYHWDADANGDWNEGDGLWIDDDGDGLFSAGDRVLVRGAMTGGETGKLLQVALVDGDGVTTDGPGSENTARCGQTPFASTDHVFWYDVYDDDNWFWSSGDGLWIDDDGDTLFTDGVDRVLVRGSMTGGESGIRLTHGSHHFGYDDGEVDLNGQYDLGEDIYAANTYLAYDDFEVNFNAAYDSGEDVYDRDYIEIWVYAEGDTAQVPTDMYHPDLEPGLRDVGFRVHVNGIRVDDPTDDYDAPTGFQAAAGWGRSRGAQPMKDGGDYNRHYEYKLTSASASTQTHLVSNGTHVDVASPTAPNKPRVWETDHKIDWETCEITWITHWKDLRRGRDNYQGFGSSSGQREESIIIDWLHPPPPPPPEPPIVIKEPLFDTITPCPLGENFYCWSIFVYNPSDEPLGSIVLTDTLPEGWEGFVYYIETHPPGLPVVVGYAPDGRPVIQLPEGLPPGGWVEIIICGFGPIEPGAEEIINRVDGEMDDDGNPDTPPVPIPGDSSSVPVVPEPEVELFKIPDSAEVTAGGTVIWLIGVVNTGRLAVDNTSLKDGDQTLPLDTLGRGHVRIAGLQTEVSATLTPSTTLTNTLTLEGEFTTSAGATRSYSTSVSATVHVTACVVCITGTVTFTDCAHAGQPAGETALESATVHIKRNGVTVATVQTDEDGNYLYCFPVPPNPTDNYSVEVMLQEGSNKFRVRNGDGGDVPTAETPQFDVPVCPPNPRFVNKDVNFTDPANSSNVPDNRRQALAAIFRETETSADFWENKHSVNLPAGGPDVIGFSAGGTWYEPGTDTIRINSADSACTSNNRPMNREWHEFNHYVDDLIDGMPPLQPGDTNHGGFDNSDSSDSCVEGWAEFWSSKTRLAEGLPNPQHYRWDGGTINLEDNYKARSRWGAQSIEELAVASLLWDLHDSTQDIETITTVITNTSPPPPTSTVAMTYTDSISITNQRIYEIMTTHAVTTVKGLYDALVAEGVGAGDSDGDGTSDLDELFIMHGFWGDDGDGLYEPDHGDGDVGWAGQDGRYDLPIPPGATLLLSVTLPGGTTVPTTTLHVEVIYDAPYSNHSLSYTHMLWTGDGDVEPFVPPLARYASTIEMWVTQGISESDHLLFGNAPYWAQVESAPFTTTHALTHTLCLGGDPYDVNCDGILSMADADAVAAHLNTAFPDLDYRPRYDLDGDGDVDDEDYQIILEKVRHRVYLPLVLRDYQ